MITEFSKGFTNAAHHAAFKRALVEGDCPEIAAVVELSGSERLPVDAFINAMPRRVRSPSSVTRIPLDSNPQVNSVEFLKELQMVVDLASMRDTPLDQLPDTLPRGLREVSPYLYEHFTVRDYKKGVDYGTTKASFSAIQAGADLAGDLQASKAGNHKIKTGRDAAAYVHTDDPMAPWRVLLNDILASNVEPKLPDWVNVEGFPGQGRFTLFGAPFYIGILGEALYRSGHTSFQVKWDNLFPRPEEMAPVMDLGYLPLAYPEGSPMHPSRVAMHSFAAQVQKHVLLKLFDGDARLSAVGCTVREAAELLSDNIGMFRLHAGVHYLSDHLAGESKAEQLASEIVLPYLR